MQFPCSQRNWHQGYYGVCSRAIVSTATQSDEGLVGSDAGADQLQRGPCGATAVARGHAQRQGVCSQRVAAAQTASQCLSVSCCAVHAVMDTRTNQPFQRTHLFPAKIMRTNDFKAFMRACPPSKSAAQPLPNLTGGQCLSDVAPCHCCLITGNKQSETWS